MTIGYRSFARVVGKNARVRRAVSALVSGGAGTNVKIEPTGGAQVEINGEIVIGGTTIDKSGYIKIIESADDDAPNGSLFFSTDQGTICYRTSGGDLIVLTESSPPPPP